MNSTKESNKKSYAQFNIKLKIESYVMHGFSTLDVIKNVLKLLNFKIYEIVEFVANMSLLFPPIPLPPKKKIGNTR